MSFLGGKNTGGDRADYYDNPNYDPLNEGKSKSSKKAEDLGEVVDNYEHKYNYLTEYVDEETDLGRGGSLKFEEDAIDAAAKSLDAQTRETVSYFRGQDRNRLNPGGVGGKQINEKFSQPSGSLDDKLGKFGFSYDPEDPDNYYGNEPQGKLSDNVFNTNRTIARNSNIPGVDPGNYTLYETTVQYEKGNPLPNTVAGVNQELQARKARTRDFAMEFRGTVFDFIDETRKNLIAHKDDIVNEYFRREDSGSTLMFNEKDIEDKYFPDEASKKAAKKELRSMVSFTDAASDITREYSTLGQLAETIVGDTPDTPMGIMDHGIRGMVGEPKLINEKLTKQNYEKSVKAFEDWKSKKGVPKIVRLISKLG